MYRTYLAADSQSDAIAAGRASTLGCVGFDRTVSPAYQRAGASPPCVVAETTSGPLAFSDSPQTTKAAVDAALVPYQAAEDAANQRVANEQTMSDRAQLGLSTNATYLALSNPTNAQNLAQIRALTRQVTALIKLTFRLLDDTSGT